MYTGPPTTTTTTTITTSNYIYKSCVLKEGYTLPEEYGLNGLFFEINECKPNEYCEDWRPKDSPFSGDLG